MKNFLKNLLKVLPLIACIVTAVIYFIHRDDISIDSVLDYAPENTLYAALFVILLYTFKSLSVFFPVIILEIVSGILFSPVTAVIVSTIGMTAGFSLSYFIGRFSGGQYADTLLQKYPKISTFIVPDDKRQFRLSFFLRAISFLPCDVVSMYLGAIKIPFAKYITGSILGTLPGLAAVTVMGSSITEPGSPAFIVSALVSVVLTLISCVIYVVKSKKKRKEDV